MERCVNENCTNDPMTSPNPVMWGCDADWCCNQQCYDAARRQMDHFCSNVLTNDSAFASWLGVPEEQVRSK